MLKVNNKEKTSQVYNVLFYAFRNLCKKFLKNFQEALKNGTRWGNFNLSSIQILGGTTDSKSSRAYMG